MPFWANYLGQIHLSGHLFEGIYKFPQQFEIQRYVKDNRHHPDYQYVEPIGAYEGAKEVLIWSEK